MISALPFKRLNGIVFVPSTDRKYRHFPVNFYLSHIYSMIMGQIIKIDLRLSVCQCVSVSVCEHSHGRISLSISPKLAQR